VVSLASGVVACHVESPLKHRDGLCVCLLASKQVPENRQWEEEPSCNPRLPMYGADLQPSPGAGLDHLLVSVMSLLSFATGSQGSIADSEVWTPRAGRVTGAER